MSPLVDRSGAAEAAVWDALRTVIAPELRGSLVDRGRSRVAALPSAPWQRWLDRRGHQTMTSTLGTSLSRSLRHVGSIS